MGAQEIVAALKAEIGRLDAAEEAANSKQDALVARVQSLQMRAAYYRALAAYGVSEDGEVLSAEEIAEMAGTAGNVDRQAIWKQRECNALFRYCRLPGDSALAELSHEVAALLCKEASVYRERLAGEIVFWLFDRFTGNESAAGLASEWRLMYGDYSAVPFVD